MAPADQYAEQIRQWTTIDPDAETVTELSRLAETDPEGAAELFAGRIGFGTAGLRAGLGPGPRRMNRVVVRQTTEALMRWLPPGARVLIANDARHKSALFARDTAAVVAAAGGQAILIDHPTPTPVLAYGVLDRGCDAGIMITASHNPATDNGYKLYLSDGLQIVSPADVEISALIDEVAAEQRLGPSSLGLDPNPDPWSDPSITVVGAEPEDSHARIAVDALVTACRQVSVVYSAMHGVGGAHLLRCFADAGFSPPAVVANQFDPDPAFPTAPFPNPEEPGAVDELVATAQGLEPRPDVLLANDPDADRLAVVVFVDHPGEGPGRWQRLTGDQVGALLADHLLSHRLGRGGPAPDGGYVVSSSIVSSEMINAIAAAATSRFGVDVASVRTLTGFKWVARPIVERPESRFLFGYEEALGYCIGDRVRDKDGITAALVMAELAACCRAEGITVWDRWNQLVARFGLYATDQVTVGFGHLSDAEAAETKSRALAIRPRELAGVAVVNIVDLSLGTDLPPTPGLSLSLADGSRVLIRPSGTEPKLKIYLEVIIDEAEAGGGPKADQTRQRAQLQLDELAASVRVAIGK